MRRRFYNTIILLALFISPVIGLKGESLQKGDGNIYISSLDEVYNISNRNWFFKAEDNLEFKEVKQDTQSWYAFKPTSPWQVHAKDISDYQGNAWYRLNIHIDELDQENEYGLILPYSYGSCQVYINGQLVSTAGKFYTDGKKSEVGSKPTIVEVPPGALKQGTNVLAVRLSAMDYWGGFAGYIFLGPLEKVKSKWVKIILRHTSIAIICIFLSFYYFLHYWQRRKEKYYLWIACLNLSVGLFVFGFNGLPLYMFDQYWAYALITFLAGINIYFMTLNFLHSFLNRKIGKVGKVFWYFYLLLNIILFAEFMLTGGIFYFQKFLYAPYLLSYPIFFIYLITVNIRAIREKVPYALPIFWGVGIFAVGFMYSTVTFVTLIEADPMVGEVFFSVIIAFSVVVATRFSHTHQDLEKAHENLKTLDKLKDDFLANTSHELRTPLIGIIGIAETLIDGAAGELSKKTKENLSMISFSGKRLSNLVNDIIDFSKLKNQNIDLQLKPIDLKPLADITLALSKPLVQNESLELVNNIGEGVPPVEADENRLQQIMYNLIGNAIKFTSEGKITVDANAIYSNGSSTASSASDEPKFVQITVSDTGIGIPRDKFETIFKSFEQADTSISRDYGGTGLGLSITKHLIELHKGEIKVESEVGQGTKFIFTLPASKQNVDESTGDNILQNVIIGQRFSPTSLASKVGSSDEKIEIIEPQEILKDTEEQKFTGVSIENVNVLIVDDELVNLQVLSNILASQKCNITKAINGMEALELMDQPDFLPDIILLDVMMPKMSGFEVCEKIRKKYSANELPIIMLTAKNQVTDLITGLAVGANDYITKPYSKNELLARINTQLSLIQATKAFGELSAIQKELAVAKSIQQSALPASLPKSRFWDISAVCLPMKAIGGDFYDYHQVDEKNLGVIVGDVSGHGIPAALTVSMFKIAFSLQKTNADNPKLLIENINKILYGHCENNFITAAYVFINTEEQVIYYTNAGHPPIFLWNVNAQKLTPLSTKGIGVGLHASPEYQMLSHKIEKGDRIIMYTDGILEARHESGEMYEESRLIKAITENSNLKAGEIMDHIVEEVDKWSEIQDDDLTMAVIDII